MYGAHFYDGFYIQPLWQLLGEGVTCALMSGFLDSRIAAILDDSLPNAAPVRPPACTYPGGALWASGNAVLGLLQDLGHQHALLAACQVLCSYVWACCEGLFTPIPA